MTADRDNRPEPTAAQARAWADRLSMMVEDVEKAVANPAGGPWAIAQTRLLRSELKRAEHVAGELAAHYEAREGAREELRSALKASLEQED